MLLIDGARLLAGRTSMQTLTMTATNLAGRPDTGDSVEVLNADNVTRFDDPIESSNVFYKGVARFSVPAGHYWRSAPRDVLLLNGSQLLVSLGAGGPRVLGMVPPSGQRPPAMMTLQAGSQALELPAATLPYLGHGLSPALFTLSALLREESGGRLPLTVSYPGRARRSWAPRTAPAPSRHRAGIAVFATEIAV